MIESLMHERLNNCLSCPLLPSWPLSSLMQKGIDAHWMRICYAYSCAYGGGHHRHLCVRSQGSSCIPSGRDMHPEREEGRSCQDRMQIRFLRGFFSYPRTRRVIFLNESLHTASMNVPLSLPSVPSFSARCVFYVGKNH